MKLEKTKNTTRNLLAGIGLKLYQILFPFFVRTVILQKIGIEYLGLNELFASVLQVLNLAELGVGSAMVFSMYKPIAEDDEDQICALMRLYRQYYSIIGAVILIIGLAITPLVPRLINGEIPEGMNVYVLYLMNLGATVLSYWLFAYRSSILQAYQRQDIISKVKIATETIKYLFQLIALILLKNYYYYVLALLISQIITNIVTAIISRVKYPQYSPRGEISEEEKKKINQRIRDLFTSKLGGVIINSVDTLVISAFLGLEMLAVYRNYFVILNAVLAFLAILHTSVLAGIGNSLITKTDEGNYAEFSLFVFIEFWAIGLCVNCFSSVFQPFITVWMGGNLLLDYPFVLLFCVYFIGYEYVMMLSVYKDAAGIWHEDRFRPLASGMVNLLLNLAMVQVIGLYGIVLSSIVSIYLISAPWITMNLFKNIFKRDRIRDYLKRIVEYLAVMILSTAVSTLACNALGGMAGAMGVILRLMICFLMWNGFFFLFFRKTDSFRSSVQVIRRIMKRDW